MKRKAQKIKNKKSIFDIKSSAVINLIFEYFSIRRKLNIAKNSKRLQKMLYLSLYSYEIFYTLDRTNRFSPVSNILQFYDILKDKYPKITQKELVTLLWNNYKWVNLSFNTINHEALQYLVPLINFSTINSIKSIHINIISKDEFISNEFNQIAKDLISLTTSFKLANDFSKRFTQVKLNNLCLRMEIINSNRIKSLVLSGIGIKGLSLNRLYDFFCKQENIINLELSNCVIGVEGIKMLSKIADNNLLCNLEYLNLSGNNIDKQSAEDMENIFRKAKFITGLDISNNNIDLNILCVLNNYASNFKRLNISYNPIRNEGFTTLMKEAHKYNKLEYLNICHIQINCGQLGEVSLNFFNKFKSLKEIDLSENNANERYLSIIIIDLSNLNNLSIIRISSVQFSMQLPIFDLLPALTEIALIDCNGIENILPSTYYIPSIRSLILEQSELKQYTFLNRAISLFPNLQVLNLSGCNINISDIVNSLISLNQMKEINFSKNKWNSQSVLTFSQALSSMHLIEHLDISSGKGLGPSEMKLIILSLFKSLNIKRINFSNIKFDRDTIDTFVSFTKICKEIKEVNINNIGLLNEYVFIIFKNKNLLLKIEKINIGNNPIDEKSIDFLILNKMWLYNMNYLNLSQLNIERQVKEKAKEHFKDVLHI